MYNVWIITFQRLLYTRESECGTCQFCSRRHKVFQTTSTTKNAMVGFKACGISQYKWNKFWSDDWYSVPENHHIFNQTSTSIVSLSLFITYLRPGISKVTISQLYLLSISYNSNSKKTCKTSKTTFPDYYKFNVQIWIKKQNKTERTNGRKERLN